MTLKTMPAAALATVLASTVLHAAPSCEQFKAAIIESSKKYEAPAPSFNQNRTNSTGSTEYWNILIFSNVRSAMSCSRGSVGLFVADADDNESASAVNILELMAIGLHAFGLNWLEALSTRNDLVQAAQVAHSQTAAVAIKGSLAKASLTISTAGVPNFQIEDSESPEKRK